jgi:hypothetical protein
VVFLVLSIANLWSHPSGWLFYFLPIHRKRVNGPVEKNMTKNEVLAEIKKLAKKLRRTPTMGDIRRKAKITEYLIRIHCTNLGNALREADLEPRGGGHRVNMVKLFEDWAQLTRKLGHPPTALEYRRAGKYGMNTLVQRCGSWQRIGERFRSLVKAEKMEREWGDVLQIIEQWKGQTSAAARLAMTNRLQRDRVIGVERPPKPKMIAGRPIYGPPLRMPVLRNAPTTEGGVMVAFGALAERLGFAIERIQTAFPDCEALREVAPGKWQRVWIEFELYSRNFLEHQHDPKGCDIIVCWVHNWPECPEGIEVIELSKVIG